MHDSCKPPVQQSRCPLCRQLTCTASFASLYASLALSPRLCGTHAHTFLNCSG